MAIAGWQPVFAAIRQGDAVLVVAGLLVGAWSLLQTNRTVLPGLLLGVSGALFLPASVMLLPVAPRSRPAFAVAVATLLLALAGSAALGGAMLFVDYAASTIASARVYAASPITYSLIAKLLVIGTTATLPAVLAAAAIAVTALMAWRRKASAALDISFASFAALAFLLSPIAWSQHVTLLVFPLTVLLARAISSRRPGWLFAWAALALLLSLPDPPNLWIDSAVRHVAGDGAASMLPTAPALAAVAIWASMLVL
jgi:hypothetical protein